MLQPLLSKANEVARKHIIKIRNMYKDTVPHEALGKVAGARIFLKPASPGTGLIAGGSCTNYFGNCWDKKYFKQVLRFKLIELTLPTQPLKHLQKLLNQPKKWVTSLNNSKNVSEKTATKEVKS